LKDKCTIEKVKRDHFGNIHVKMAFQTSKQSQEERTFDDEVM